MRLSNLFTVAIVFYTAYCPYKLVTLVPTEFGKGFREGVNWASSHSMPAVACWPVGLSLGIAYAAVVAGLLLLFAVSLIAALGWAIEVESRGAQFRGRERRK